MQKGKNKYINKIKVTYKEEEIDMKMKTDVAYKISEKWSWITQNKTNNVEKKKIEQEGKKK